MYLKVVEAEVLTTTCHYCERVLKQGCRNEESFQAEVTESKGHCPVAGDLEVAPVCHSPHKRKMFCRKESTGAKRDR